MSNDGGPFLKELCLLRKPLSHLYPILLKESVSMHHPPHSFRYLSTHILSSTHPTFITLISITHPALQPVTIIHLPSTHHSYINHPSTIHPSIMHPSTHHSSIYHHPSTIHPYYPSLYHLSIHPTTLPGTYSTNLSIYLPMNPTIHQSIHYLSIHPSIYPSFICPSK